MNGRSAPEVPAPAAPPPAEAVPFAGEECRLTLAVAFESTLRAAGLAWRLTTPSGPGPVVARARRHGRSRLTAELLALRLAAPSVGTAGCRGVVVRTDDLRLVRAVEGRAPRLDARSRAHAQRLRRLLERAGGYRLEVVRPPADAEVARAATVALDEAIHAATERRERRAVALEEVIARSRSVHLQRRDGVWVANGRYVVRLDPPSCECPAWARRWARVPLAGRRAARLPCKHLVAVALREGQASLDELAALGRHAPP